MGSASFVARQPAGIPAIAFQGISFHNLRKTCASRLVQNNVPIHYVSKILGHASVDITASYYADLAPSEASRAAVDVLNKLHSVKVEATESAVD